MKRIIEHIMSMKLNACICFTGFLMVNALAQLWFGAKPLTGWGIIGFLLLGMVCGLLQHLFFYPEVIRQMSYFRRSLGFGASMLAALALCAVCFGWFPVNQWGAWAIFFGIFVVIFLVVMVAFEMVFRITGRRYTTLLGEKQAEK